eukprot:scaffold203_cov386-Prasinococcus_capsulatus_cf.AAC.17
MADIVQHNILRLLPALDKQGYRALHVYRVNFSPYVRCLAHLLANHEVMDYDISSKVKEHGGHVHSLEDGARLVKERGVGPVTVIIAKVDCSEPRNLETEGGDFQLANGELERDSKLLDSVYREILSKFSTLGSPRSRARSPNRWYEDPSLFGSFNLREVSARNGHGPTGVLWAPMGLTSTVPVGRGTAI